MKKGALCAALSLLLTLTTLAQGRESQVESSFRLKGGWNVATITNDDKGAAGRTTPFRAFHVGLVCDLPMSAGFSFQGGVLYSVKGVRTEVGKSGDAGYCKTASCPYYLEMPLNFIGKIPLGFTRLMIGAGPYVAMGIGGMNKTERVVSQGSVSYSNRDIQFEEGEITRADVGGYPQMKRFDYGVNGLAGFEFKRFTIVANYGYGLSNIVPEKNNNDNTTPNKNKSMNRVLAFSFGIKI